MKHVKRQKDYELRQCVIYLGEAVGWQWWKISEDNTCDNCIGEEKDTCDNCYYNDFGLCSYDPANTGRLAQKFQFPDERHCNNYR